MTGRVYSTLIGVLLTGCAAGGPAIQPRPARHIECGYTMPDSSRVFAEPEVDDPAQMVGSAPMSYGDLRGTDGRVTLTYVIDSRGAVVAASVRVVAASDERFVPLARATLLASKFKAAVYHGTPVNACVEQSFNWKTDDA